MEIPKATVVEFIEDDEDETDVSRTHLLWQLMSISLCTIPSAEPNDSDIEYY